MTPALYYVRWRDAAHPGGEWYDIGDMLTEDTIVDTIGWLVAENDKFLVFAATIYRDPKTKGPQLVTQEMTIPRAMVVSKKRIANPLR